MQDLEQTLNRGGPLWGQIVAHHVCPLFNKLRPGHRMQQLELFAPLYMPYITGFEKAKETEAGLSQHTKFGTVCDKIKAHTTAAKTCNVGIKELLAEPFQRIPRYKMILEGASLCLFLRTV